MSTNGTRCKSDSPAQFSTNYVPHSLWSAVAWGRVPIHSRSPCLALEHSVHRPPPQSSPLVASECPMFGFLDGLTLNIPSPPSCYVSRVSWTLSLSLPRLFVYSISCTAVHHAKRCQELGTRDPHIAGVQPPRGALQSPRPTICEGIAHSSARPHLAAPDRKPSLHPGHKRTPGRWLGTMAFALAPCPIPSLRRGRV